MGVREVLADELKFFFVEQRCLHDDRELAAEERRDLGVDVLDGGGEPAAFAPAAMSRDMDFSVLHDRRPISQAAANKAEPAKSLTQAAI